MTFEAKNSTFTLLFMLKDLNAISSSIDFTLNLTVIKRKEKVKK